MAREIRVDSIANKHGLKKDEFGISVMDKSPYRAKEMPTYRYNEKDMREIGKYVNQGTGA